ncbi:Tripartite motif-containing protein 55 [Dissostichus eleginoides]|uniref:Tripartite motif-containing protein 55 n=1 Tax=Dissostichus eleginoides TaxID=100907 RepID=A0AAD9BNE1_DISEL|nr:Tripartite motif-containing protein 55 [Dissostichus eleginoides]
MNSMENLEKQLICPICLEIFTKPVVILPCQHNLCRKCANDVSLLVCFLPSSSSSSSTPASERKEESPMCAVHEGEKINIYCVTHGVPTCSMCKVFGEHKDCEVAPISSIFQTKKSELSDGIAMMVGNNDRMQGIVSQLEEACRVIEKTLVCEKFDLLYSVLEGKKRDMSQKVTSEQDEKLTYIRGLNKKYGEHLEESCKMVEHGIQNMEEPEMALFLQNTKPLLKKLTDACSTAHLDKVERGYENMDHFSVEFTKEGRALKSLDFLQGERRLQ